MWPAVITFDCYGTLVRWPETLRSVFSSLVPEGTDVVAFHNDFAQFHIKYKEQNYQPYSEVLRQALAATMGKWRLAEVAHAQEQLLASIRIIPAYEDVVPVLRAISERHRIAIISNTEDDLIKGTVRGLGIECAVITAEQARAYKPNHQLFKYAHRKLNVTSENVLHVGAGWATDMVPAFELNLARVWINRRGEQPDVQRPPTAILQSLIGLELLIPRLRQTGTGIS